MKIPYSLFYSLLLFVWIFSSVEATADYYVVPVTSKELDVSARTHVVIATRGNDLGTALQFAAASKIWRLKALFPKDQILFIATQEYKVMQGESEDLGARLLNEMGFLTVNTKRDPLTLANLMAELKIFSSIASFHFFSHGSPISVFLDRIGVDTDLRWMTEAPESSQLKGHFTQDAFAVFYACNSGHAHAPYLMRLWNIPVAGSLTGTHLEKLAKDNKFYWADENGRRKQNSCHSSDCYRFRPDNAVYQGTWGIFKQGLPLVKFFCPKELDSQCLAAMAASLASTVSSGNKGANMSPTEYANTVREWICPAGQKGSSIQSRCMTALKKIDATAKDRSYTPMKGNSSNCSFLSCYVESECLKPSVRVCARELPVQSSSTTFVDEYQAYLRAYPFLRNLRTSKP